MKLNMNLEMKTFKEFWPYYLGQHQNPINRALHYLGTFLFLTVTLKSLMTKDYQLLMYTPLLGYLPAWIGHFFFEKNRPATFRHPLWSLRGDFQMVFEALKAGMKKISYPGKLSALFFLFILHSHSGQAAPSIGDSAPDFELKGHDGKVYKLSDFKNKWIVLEWYNEGCPFVKKHYDSGNMQKTQKTFTEKGVQWFAVLSSAPGSQGHADQDGAARLKKDKNSFATALLLDPEGKAGRNYGAKTTPHMFVVNPQGKVSYAGAIDDHPSTDPEDIPKSTNYVTEALNALLAGKPVKTAKSKPYGCSVKYKD